MAFFSLHGLLYVVAWTMEGRLLELVRYLQHNSSFFILIITSPMRKPIYLLSIGFEMEAKTKTCYKLIWNWKWYLV